MSRHYRRHSTRRNPSGMAGAAMPIALVAAGLYLLHKGSTVAAAIPAPAPVNGLGGLLGQLGFSFSSVFQGAGNVIKQTIAAPIQLAARVAIAPVKLATGSSLSSVVSSIKQPVLASAAAIRNMSPGHIAGKGGTSTSTNGTTTQYYDAQNNVITQAQYNALQQAVGSGQNVGPVTDVSGTWWALAATGTCTTVNPGTSTPFTNNAPAATQTSIATYYDPNGSVLTVAQYDAEMSAIGLPASTAVSGQIQVPQPTSAIQAQAISNAAMMYGAPPYNSSVFPATSPTGTTGAMYLDPNGQSITQAAYNAEMAAMGLAPSYATTGQLQVPAPTTAIQAQALSNAAAANGAPYINPATVSANTASGVPTYWDPNGQPISYAHYEYELSSGLNPQVIQTTALTPQQQQLLLNQTNSGGDLWQPPQTAATGGGGGGGIDAGGSGDFTNPNYNAQGTSYQDPSQGGGGPGGTAPQPDPNAPAGTVVATASKTNWFAVGGAVIAVPVLMHFMNK